METESEGCLGPCGLETILVERLGSFIVVFVSPNPVFLGEV